MDPTMITEPGGLYGWLMANGAIVQFFAQMIYWLGMLVALFYAVWQYKRWVNYQLGIGKSGKLRRDLYPEGAEAAGSTTASSAPNVDEFVD